MKKLFLLSLILTFLLFSCTSIRGDVKAEITETKAADTPLKEEIKIVEEPVKEDSEEKEEAGVDNEITVPLALSELSGTVERFSYAYGITTMSEILSSGISFNATYFSKGLYDAYYSPLSPSLSSLSEVNSIIEEYISGNYESDIAFGRRPESIEYLVNLPRDESFPLLFSYAYGFSVMQSIRFSEIELSLLPFITGMNDEIYESPKLMNDEEVSAAIDDYITYLNEEYYLSLEKEAEAMEEKASQFLEMNKKEEGVITLDNGVQILYLEERATEGRQVAQYDTVIMDYNEYVLDYESFELEFTDVVRDEEVHIINLSNALQSAVVMMREGDAVRVFIPPELSDKYEIDEIGLLYVYDIAIGKIL